MKKIADFIVKKRVVILAVMLIFTVVCAVLMPQVNINTDMTKYLPDNSSMHIGLDLMAEEFPETELMKTVRVMFKGLDETQKTGMQRQLEELAYVDSVTYDEESADYNKDGYTLYVINTTYNYGSAEERAIESALQEKFSQYDMTFKNDNTSTSDVPLWIIATAVALIMVILFVMCSSWTEPFLFLITIGVAVVINMGTNIFLGSVSNITFSIAAILQLVLSMDYSIILMNRYRQEMQRGEDRLSAMKNALRGAFSSITSSAMTTVVGLLALVFMSFKIGMDLGVVLAKGILISMLCVFTVLPGLIVICQPMIEKTAKKQLHLGMGGVSAFCFRFRRVFAAGFAALFLAAFFLQSNTKTAYTLETKDPIADIFPVSNTIVMLYENGDEKQVTDIAGLLEQQDSVKSALNFSTTLGRPYSAAELTGVLGQMGADVQLDPSMLSMLYYNYFKGEQLPTVTVGEFINFVTKHVLTNEAFASYLDDDVKANVDRMQQFSDARNLTQPMGAAELATFFGMDASDARQLLLYYYTQNGGVDTGTMTLPTFASFVTKQVASDAAYSGLFDSAALAQLQLLSTFTDTARMTAPCTPQEIAGLLGMDEQTAKLLFVYCYAGDSGYDPGVLTLPVFLQFVCGDVAGHPLFSTYFDAATLAQLNATNALVGAASSGAVLTAPQMAASLGMDAGLTDQIFAMYFGGTPGQGMTLEQFVDFLLSDVVTNPAFAPYFDAQTIGQFSVTQALIKSAVSGTAYSAGQMAQLLTMQAGTAKTLYTYYVSQHGDSSGWRISPQAAVNTLVGAAGQLGGMVDAAQLAQLRMAQGIIGGSVAGTRYTSRQLAALTGMDAGQLDQLYLLYLSKHGDTSGWRISAQRFVAFLADDVLKNPAFSDLIPAEAAGELTVARTLVDAVVSGKKYTPAELETLIGGSVEGLNSGTLELLYLYYGGFYDSSPDWRLSIEALSQYLSEDVVNDPRFAAVLDETFRAQIVDMRTQVDGAAAQLKGGRYSLLMLSTTLPDESEQTTAFFDSLTAQCGDKLQGNYYLIGSSAMNYEMAQTFDREMLLITLLTAIAIFLVVALTFRSLIVPAILVLIVQCGVYLTVVIIGLQGYSIYYLALLIVQCILMGATIDYSILFTNYYREKRETLPAKDALAAAYDGSVHTILTSGLIMVVVTGIVGYLFTDPTVGQICQTISIGALCATLLILFVLPGLLATFDRLVVGRKRRK